MTERNPVRNVVRYALTAGVAASSVGAPAATLAQDDVAVQDKVTVTGSRIKRVDIEGPSPITSIAREDIDASGDISVSEVLRGNAFNSFGSFRPQYSSESAAAVDLRGLGSQRTLVLIDGRRITGAPQASGSIVNLNSIPLNAVERIEILRDGASAIYGSDAIGGVVNIILRKDYEGMTLAVDVGRPTQTGGDEDVYSITGGVSGAKGNITFGFENRNKQIIFQGDRSFSATGLSAFGFPGSYFAFLTTSDPRNPTGSFLAVGTFADPRCPANLGTDPNYQASVEVPFNTPDNQGLCRYNYAGVAANEAATDAKSIFLNANYDINETTTFFTRGTFTFTESFGRYAPSPFAFPLPSMSQNNPNNPTAPGATSAETGDQFDGQSVQVDTDGDGMADTTVAGPFDLSLFYRNVPGGFRDRPADDSLIDYLAGVQGTVDWLGGMDWELGAQWSQAKTNGPWPSQALQPNLQADIDDGTFDPHAVNTAWAGPEGDGQRAAQEAAAVTYLDQHRFRMINVDSSVTFDALEMKNGVVPIVLGFEYRDDDYEYDSDEQSNAAGIEDVSGARTVKSLFAETMVPVLSNFDINGAARYDDYNDFGTTVNPKLSVSFRPLDSLLLRGSWGQGYRAPSMSELYSSQSQPFVSGAIDTTSCAADPLGDPNTGRSTVPESALPSGNPCLLTQYQNFQGGNRNLGAEKSDQWSAGLVWNPLDELSIAVDWFDIEIEDEIGVNSMQALFDDEFALRQAGASGDTVGKVTRLTNGRVDFVDRRVQNFAKRETDGLDIDAQYGFSAGNIGDFRLNLQMTYVNEYERDEGSGLEDPRGLLDPEMRATFAVNWALADFSANVTVNYISEATDASRNIDLDSYTTVDLQVGYATPWNGQVSVGARNVFDEDPPTSTQLGSPFYSGSLHDVYGRVPYIRYSQDL